MTGRLEFCNNGIWGTVCSNLFEALDANVVCRQLGFRSTGDHVYKCIKRVLYSILVLLKRTSVKDYAMQR